jgi:TPR repeat protein
VLIEGDGVPADPERGVRIAELAAATGDAAALNFLGYLYGTGTGVPADVRRAAGHYLEAAQAGNESARMNLGFLYRDSGGETPAREVALEGVSQAADAGQPGAAELLAGIEAMPWPAPVRPRPCLGKARTTSGPTPARP